MTQIGPFDVQGAPPKRETWIRSALAALDADVDPKLLLPRTVPLIFGPVANVPGTNSPAVGYTEGRPPKCRIRHNMANASNLDRDTTEYTALHEGLGHARLRLRPMPEERWARAIALVKGPDPQQGDVVYWFRKLEVLIDAMVEALSGLESPYRYDPNRPMARSHYKRWIDDADLPTLKAIWLEPDPVVVDPPPDEPDPPLPPPTDPCAAEKAAIDVLNQQLAAERAAHDQTRADLAMANQRIAGKDQSMQEGLAK